MSSLATAEAIKRQFVRSWAPPPKLTVSSWADQHRFLSREGAAEPGKWRTDRGPYQRGIMDAVNEAGIETVVVMSSAQIGKSECLLNIVGYYLTYDPTSILFVFPTLDLAQSFSKDRLSAMCRDSPVLAPFHDEQTRKSSSTILHKKYPGGQITLAGANSPTSLSSRPVRIVLMDEVDRFPASVANGEGDPVDLARKRTATFWNRKIILTSTPTVKGVSRIEQAFNESDQRHYLVPCPECGLKQELQWERLIWEKTAAGHHRPESAQYRCAECQVLIPEYKKEGMIRAGSWVAKRPTAKVAGFHINELYSPWRRWSEIVEDHLTAKTPEKMKVWFNTSLGLPYQDTGDVPDWRRLYERREDYKIGVVPLVVRKLTVGIDIQIDRIECLVLGWGPNKESWIIEHAILIGRTSEEDVWRDLDRFIEREWPHESGVPMSLDRIAIDSGYQTTRVYEWCRTKSQRRVLAIKGRDNIDVPLGTPRVVEVNIRGQKIRRGVRLWPVGVSVLKMELYGRLRLQAPTDEERERVGFPPGYVHFPMVDERFFRSLTAESCHEKRTKTGHTKREWVRHYPANEVLDCFVYAMAISGR